MISPILRNNSFAPLMWTQFFGALNDNILKNALIVLVAFKGIELWGLKSEALVSLATLIFIFPFFLFSALAGQVADKFEKSKLIRIIKIAEVFIMLLAGFGFYFGIHSILFLVLFLMGLHSTFFGPVKYSAIPELVAFERLTSANAYVEIGTFIAILIGTIAGGHLISLQGGEMYVLGILIIISLFGFFTSLAIPKIKIADPGISLQINPIPPTFSSIKHVNKNKTVFNSILGISWFWLLGAVILSLLPTITTKILNGDEHIVTLFLSVFTIGIALGAIACEKLSFDRVEIGLVPFGSLGISIFIVDLATILLDWPALEFKIGIAKFLSFAHSYRLLVDLTGIAVFGGIFTVPLYTLIQQRSDREYRSRVIGANNIINSLFMVIGSAALMLLLQKNVSIPTILFAFSIFNFLITLYIYSLVPEFTLRFLAWVLARCMYRLRVKGHSHIPYEGRAILVCNHVSYVDWLILAAAIKRPIRFVMYYKFSEIPVFKYLMKQAGVIPIAGKNEDPNIFSQAFIQVAESLAQGDLVCIFPEGNLTKTGEIQEFKKGIEHILAKNPVPVVPMALEGLWGSLFSHHGAKAKTKLARRFWYPIQLTISPPLQPENVTALALEMKVKDLLHSSVVNYNEI